MSTVVSPAVEQRVVVQASWETYERLLAEYPDVPGPRFTYNEGVLEIMVLFAPHEEPNRTLALVVELVAAERGVEVRRIGSTTFKRAELLKGFEPDSAFYIAHGPEFWGRDINPDPPPDLIIEIDVSDPPSPASPSLRHSPRRRCGATMARACRSGGCKAVGMSKPSPAPLCRL